MIRQYNRRACKQEYTHANLLFNIIMYKLAIFFMNCCGSPIRSSVRIDRYCYPMIC